MKLALIWCVRVCVCGMRRAGNLLRKQPLYVAVAAAAAAGTALFVHSSESIVPPSPTMTTSASSSAHLSLLSWPRVNGLRRLEWRPYRTAHAHTHTVSYLARARAPIKAA